ncbi:outer membrane beta-barrel protein [Nonlabens sp. YIK11]|uniref:outer membrane beta-barrel protein n=1 Tax=Nonlabens sp. YIK11 TaxID=1453349 RepID=UPI0009E95D63|nr:outer membrane beta-barrel protein [Nonlabens sp. YIK11]
MKHILLLALIASFSMTSIAQIRNETSYGVRLGANYSDLETDLFEDAENRIAPSVTFFAEIPLGNTFSIVPELGFNALGVKEESVTAPDGNEVNFKSNWLNTGVLVQANITRFLYLNVGPKAAVNVSENDDNDYYDYDLMGVGGIGVRITNGLSIDARYGYGFKNIYSSNLEAQGYDAENRFYQLTLSYRM